MLLSGRALKSQATFTAGIYNQNFGNTTDPGFPYSTASSWVDNSYYPGWYTYQNAGIYRGVTNITGAAPTNSGGIYMYTLNGGTGLLLGTRPSDNSVGTAGADTNNVDGTVSTFGLALGLCMMNNTGTTIQSINVQYDYYQLSTAQDGGQDNANWFDYLQSSSIPSITDPTFTNVPSMTYVGPNVTGLCCTAQVSGLPGTVTTHFNNCITVTVPPGQYIMFRWWDPDDAHDDPHFAIDNVQITVASVTASAAPPTICTGSSTTLTASGSCNTYTWAPNTALSATTGASVTANPSVSTTYTVTGTLTGCGTATATVAVNVNTTPTLTASATPTIVCSGDSIALQSSGLGVGGTYAWTPSASINNSADSNAMAAPGSTTTYSIDGTSAAGCAAAEQTVVVTVNATPTISLSATAGAICAGNSDILNAGGASTYSWQPGALTGSTVSVSPAGTTVYTVTGTSAAGCTSTPAFILVTINPTPTITASASPTVICSGTSSVLSASNANTYFWSTGVTGSSITVSPGVSTTYTVTGTSALGCNSAPFPVPLTVNATPTVTVSATPSTICSGNSTTLKANNASTYTWQPGGLSGSTVSVSPAANTVYTVSGVSAAGCPAANKTVSVTVNTTPTITASVNTATICSGNSDTLNASGTSTYVWQPGSLTGSTVSVSPGTSTTYTVVGSSPLLCPSAPVTVSITVNITPTITASAAPSTICSGNSTTLTAHNALTYTWQPGSLTGSTISVAPDTSTTYSVIGIDATLCPSAPVSVSVIVDTTPVVTASAAPSTICSGNSTTLTAHNASTYLWQPGGLTGSTVSVSPGATITYSVVGTSASLCPSTPVTVPVTVNITPTITASASPATICSGDTSLLSANSAATYVWQPGALTGSTINVEPGASVTYTVVGTSVACPSAPLTVTVTVNPTPTVIASANLATICSDSSSTLSASGALNYVWQPGGLTGSTESVTPLTSTTYTVVGTSGALCPSAPVTVPVNVNTTPTITVSASQSTICSGNSTTLTASGAATYSWQPGGMTGSTVSVSPGSTTTYTVTGTSLALCPSSAFTVVVTVNITPTITASASQPVICSGNSTTLTANNGSSYTWEPGSLTGSSISVSPGTSITYTVSDTSAAGCGSANVTVPVTVNQTPTLSLTPLNPAICPAGNVNLTASSTTASTTYTWAPGASLNTTTGSVVNATPVANTTYTVNGTAAGCPSLPDSVVVTIVTSLTVTVLPTAPTICSGDSVVLSAGGASTFIWTPSTGLTCTTCSNPKAGPTDTTIYKVYGSSGTCLDSATAIVSVNPTPTVTIAIGSGSICPGDSTSLIASGATTYVWSPVTGINCSTCDTINAGPLTTKTYTVTGSFATGCSSTASQALTVFPKPVVNITPPAATFCSSDSVTLVASGVSSYTWAPSTALNVTTGATVVASPTTNTYYVVTGTGIGGCVKKDSALITVNATPTVTILPAVPVICSGDSITLNASGALNYEWMPSGGLNCTTCSSPHAGPANATTYTVVGISLKGCTDTTLLTVTVNTTPTVSVVSTNTTTICSSDTSFLKASGAATYTWSPSIGLSASTGANVSALPNVTTTYTVTGSNGSGCSSTDSIVINVIPSPTLSVSATATPICSGTSTTLTASGGSAYTWSPAGSLSASTGSSVTASPLVTTTYTVSAINGGACASIGNVVLTITPTPTMVVTQSAASICLHDSVILGASGAATYAWTTGQTTDSITVKPSSSTTYTVTGKNGACTGIATATVTVNLVNITGTPVKPALCIGDSTVIDASGAATYTWFPSTGLNVTTGISVTATPAITTTYTLAGVSAFGCSDTTKVIITVNSLPVVKATSSVPTICSNGSTATLNASGASSYTWSPSTGLNQTTGSPVVADPSSSFTYTVTGTDAKGCSDTASVRLTVVAPPAITITATGGDSVCNGTSKILSASGGISYVWKTNPVQTTDSITVTPSASTTYTVIGSNGICVDSAKVSIFLDSPFTVGIVNDTLCAGNTANISANVSGGSLPYTYIWSNGLGTLSSAAITVLPGPVTYTCTVSNGCGQTIPGTVVVDGASAPNAAFTITPDTVPGGQLIGFINSNSGGNNWFWAMGDGVRFDSTSSIIYSYDQPGTYYVTLWVLNRFGCIDSAIEGLYVTEGIYIPNVFTPNGDGQNDVFHVSTNGMKTYNIEIFNRWGEKVFQSNSLEIDWDGTTSSGIEESTGQYYYIVKVSDFANKQYVYKGYVELLR